MKIKNLDVEEAEGALEIDRVALIEVTASQASELLTKN